MLCKLCLYLLHGDYKDNTYVKRAFSAHVKQLPRVVRKFGAHEYEEQSAEYFLISGTKFSLC